MTPLQTPDPEAVRDERFGKGSQEGNAPADQPKRRGRPPGKKNRPKAGAAPEAPQIRTPEEIAQGAAMCTFLAATLWNLIAPLAGHRPIDDAESSKLGAALDPVLYKYLPALENWHLEINLLIVVAGLWMATEIPTEVPAVPPDEPMPGANRLSID